MLVQFAIKNSANLKHNNSISSSDYLFLYKPTRLVMDKIRIKTIFLKHWLKKLDICAELIEFWKANRKNSLLLANVP